MANESVYIGWLGPLQFTSSAAGTVFPVPMTIGPLSITSTAVTSTVPYVAPLGSAATPAVSATGFTDTGMYWPNQAGVVAFSSAGTVIMKYSVNSAIGVSVNSTVPIGWSTDVINAAPDIILTRLAADVVAPGAGDAYGLASKAWIRTAPTVTSAGTSPSVVASNGTAAFTVNVGTGGTATTVVMAMPAATTGWIAQAENMSQPNAANLCVRQTGSTTTSITLQWQTVSTGVATAFAASDVLSVMATAY